MMRDTVRIDGAVCALEEAGLDGLVGALPAHVLLLAGYWPVVGNALAVLGRDGRTAIVAPQDEKELAQQGWADEVHTFQPASPSELKPLAEAVRGPLGDAAKSLGLEHGRIGYEQGPWSEPAPYAAMNEYGASLVALLQQAFPSAHLDPGDETFRRLESIESPRELEHVRLACRIVEDAYRRGAVRLHPGLLETEAAANFATPLSTGGTGYPGVERGGGHAWCMSGPNAAEGQKAYARSRAKPIARGELVLVHCNAYADGYWVDVTRTYCLGAPDRRQGELYDAVFQARAEALNAVRPGARAADIDRAARGVLEARGFGDQFKHPAGHGAGFHAIDHQARPRLCSNSTDVLEPGMVFNLEPAVYFNDDCGLRHCDMVAVTGDGHELLSPFHDAIDQLIL